VKLVAAGVGFVLRERGHRGFDAAGDGGGDDVAMLAGEKCDVAGVVGGF
jgi:hypothetical protein